MNRKRLSTLIAAALLAIAPAVTSALQPLMFTMDNSSATNFSCSTNWVTGTAALDKYGTDYRYRATQAVSDDARFWAANVPAGTWKVRAWWPMGTNRSANACWTLPDGRRVYVNQQANGGRWNLLGSVTVSTGTQTTRLSPWASTGYVVVADAVRYDQGL